MTCVMKLAETDNVTDINIFKAIQLICLDKRNKE